MSGSGCSGRRRGRRSARPGLVSTGIAALLAVVAAGCARRSQPNVVVVVVDTLRADRVGGYGGPRGLTPFLDRLSARGTLFEHAYATSTWTMPSVASLMTSRYPLQHHVTAMESVLSASEQTLAESLARRGYASVGGSANLLLSHDMGWGQGFDSWTTDPRTEKLPANRLRRTSLRAVDAARRARPGAPVFLYVQYMEPHLPYDAPPEYRRRYVSAAGETVAAQAERKVNDLAWEGITAMELEVLRSLYAAEVAYVDHEIARLFAALARRGLLENAIVVVTADHGEEFNEHGLMGHGVGLYDNELRVPLILAGIDVPAGRVVRDGVSLVDVAPTVLALVGAPAEARFEGRSLVPLFTADGPVVDVIAQLEPMKGKIDLRHHTAGIVRGNEKVVTLMPGFAAALGEAALYNLAVDPSELYPVAFVGGPDSPKERRAAALLAASKNATQRLASSGPTAPESRALDEGQRQRLRALGYVE